IWRHLDNTRQCAAAKCAVGSHIGVLESFAEYERDGTELALSISVPVSRDVRLAARDLEVKFGAGTDSKSGLFQFTTASMTIETRDRKPRMRSGAKIDVSER